MATLRALKCLVAVLDCGSVTGAAARLHLSQPALSHQLAALEREVGAAVLERLPRGVRATSAGRAMLADARLAVDAAQRCVHTGRAVAAGTAGTLRLGCAESMTASLLAPLLRGWRRRNPGITVELTELTSADALADAVGSGTVDVAVGPRPSRWDGAVTVLGVEEIVVAAARSAIREDTPSVPWQRLAEVAVVHYHPDNGLGGWLDEAAARHGVVLHPVTRTRQAVTAAQLAAAGLGVALVPTSALGAGYPGAVRSLDPPLRRDIVAVAGARTDTLAGAFVTAAAERGVPVPAAIAAQLAPVD